MYKKSLGQHFFSNIQLLEKLIDMISIGKNNVALEIGTGYGTLTKILQRKCGYVISCEIDKNLYDMAKKQLNFGSLFLFNCDILIKKQFNPILEEFVQNVAVEKNLIPIVVSNPPYNIISPLLEVVISSRIFFKDIYLTMQKEIAQRLDAEPGSKEYSSLTVFVKSFCNVKILKWISKECFKPAPQVDSAFIHIKPIEKFDGKFKDYSKFLKAVFSQRRKNIRNVFRGIFGNNKAEEILSDFALGFTERCENIKPLTLKKIYEKFYI